MTNYTNFMRTLLEHSWNVIISRVNNQLGTLDSNITDNTLITFTLEKSKHRKIVLLLVNRFINVTFFNLGIYVLQSGRNRHCILVVDGTNHFSLFLVECLFLSKPLLRTVQHKRTNLIVLYVVAAFLNLLACSFSHILVPCFTALIAICVALQCPSSVKAVFVDLPEETTVVLFQPEDLHLSSSLYNHKRLFSTFTPCFYS